MQNRRRNSSTSKCRTPLPGVRLAKAEVTLPFSNLTMRRLENNTGKCMGGKVFERSLPLPRLVANGQQSPRQTEDGTEENSGVWRRASRNLARNSFDSALTGTKKLCVVYPPLRVVTQTTTRNEKMHVRMVGQLRPKCAALPTIPICPPNGHLR